MNLFSSEIFTNIVCWCIQDPQTKDWVLTNENKIIGCFPSFLFSNLTSTDQVGWGGRTSTSTGSPSPPMGFGHFPDDVFGHESYFNFVTYQNAWSRKELTKTISDKPNCFSAKYDGDEGKGVGCSLQFGGPGG